ncbi:MAG: hypothetical protein V1742_05580 [Pseudomonadota bacterium]
MYVELDCLKRRALLHSPATGREQLKEIGREMAQAGYLPEAVDFLVQAGDEAGLVELLQTALEEGDLFIFIQILKALGRQATRAEWETLEKSARRLGKEAFAAKAAAAVQADAGGVEAAKK